MSLSSCSASNDQPPRAAVIFLDMDGVMIGDQISVEIGDKIRKKVVELYGQVVLDEMMACSRFNYHDIRWMTAASFCLSPVSLTNLQHLIEKVSKVMRVAIVISSDWRQTASVDELKTQMFGNHPFAAHIIDKTAHPPFVDEANGLNRYANRAEQIEYWLKMNRGKWNVQSHVIIDDDDMGFSRKFPRQFIETNMRELLTEAHVERAYTILTQ